MQCLPVIDGNLQQLVLYHSQLAVLGPEIAEGSEPFLRFLGGTPPFVYFLQFDWIIP